MKTILFVLITLSFHSILFGQSLVQKIEREDLIGQRIKFLKDNDNVHGYMGFGKRRNAFPYIEYQEFVGRTATFIDKNDDLFTLRMDDNGRLVYFKHYEFSDIPKNIGMFSLLDSARVKYINRNFFDRDGNHSRVISIEFAEDDGQFSQLYGPYNVYYTVGVDTMMVNLHFTETYGPKDGYTYEHQRNEVFEYVFKFGNFDDLDSSNVEDKFKINTDRVEKSTTYIHSLFASGNRIRGQTVYSLDFSEIKVLSKVTVANQRPILSFVSNYRGEDWLFHSRLKVLIGDSTMETSEVRGKREVLRGAGVQETNYYDEDSDKNIVKWIAQNYEQNITVRFYGTSYYHDIELSKGDKYAIKETYELYELLSGSRNQTE